MTVENNARTGWVPSWRRGVGRYRFLEYIDNVLRGCGQVTFMNNSLTGIVNLVAMFWGAYAGGTTLAAAVGSLVGTLVSTAAAYPLRGDRGALRTGLYGFNGMLLGAGIPTFLDNTALMWVVLIFAAAIVTVVTLAVDHVLRAWKTPGLTFPYVLTTWLVLLAAYRLSGLSASGLPSATLVSGIGVTGNFVDIPRLIHATLTSVSQVYFVDNPVSGAIFLVALLVHSRWCAALAAFGAMAAVACALILGADPVTISHGLWGYSAVLTAPAVGCIFMAPTPRTLALGAIAAVFTVFVQGAVAGLAQTVGLPALTFPFVVTTWLFLLAQGDKVSKVQE
jgi:urea transporter